MWPAHVASLCGVFYGKKRHIARPHGRATWACHMAVPHGRATWSCHMGGPSGPSRFSPPCAKRFVIPIIKNDLESSPGHFRVAGRSTWWSFILGICFSLWCVEARNFLSSPWTFLDSRQTPIYSAGTLVLARKISSKYFVPY